MVRTAEQLKKLVIEMAFKISDLEEQVEAWKACAARNREEKAKEKPIDVK